MSLTIPFACVLLALSALLWSAEAHAQTPAPSSAFSGPDIEFAPPCVRTGDTVSCWGPNGGGLSLARVPELDGVTGLVMAGDGVCGTRGGEVVCLTARPDGPTRAQLLSHEGDLGCTVEASGALRCDSEPLHLRGRVLSVLWNREVLRHISSSAAVVLYRNGRVSCAHAWCDSLREVVQIEGPGALACARTRRGAITCGELWQYEYPADLDATILTSFDGRSEYTDLAVSWYGTVCALDAAGVVSCVSRERVDSPDGWANRSIPSTGRVHALPDTGVRAIAFYGESLCLLDDAGVLCDGLPNMEGVAVEVDGLPPVRSAAISPVRSMGCAIDREDALHCWGGPNAPRRIREGVIAVELEEVVGTRYTLETTGALVVEESEGPGVATLPAFWPGAPREVALTIGPNPHRGPRDSVVCASAADEVRCAEVRFMTDSASIAPELMDAGALARFGPGAFPEAPLPIDAVTEEHRALTRRREPRSELDEDGSWWFRDARDGRHHLRDDIVWTTRSSLTWGGTHGGIDREGRLWITSGLLTAGIAGATGRAGTWARISPLDAAP